MLAGRKPFALFHSVIFKDEKEDEIDHAFSDPVRRGNFVAHEQREILDEPRSMGDKVAIGTRLRLFARKEEAWRIPAYLLLMKVREGQPWNDVLELYVTSLLGYSDAESRAWIKHIHEIHGAWGAIPGYIALAATEGNKLKALGFRALPIDLQGPLVLILSSDRPSRNLFVSQGIPNPDLLVKLPLNSKYCLGLESIVINEGRVVHLDPSQIAEVNLNLKANIEVIGYQE